MREKDGIRYFTSPGLERSGVVHAFLGRTGGASPPPYGSLNFDGRRGDSPGNVAKNMELLSRRFGVGVHGGGLVTLNQVHGDKAVIVESANLEDSSGKEGDIIVTAVPGAAIGVLTADCLPVLLHDRARGVAAAVHAGWKGTLLDVCGKALRVMSEAFGSRTDSVAAALGPRIGACCYTVGPEVIEAFEERYGGRYGRGGYFRAEGSFRLDIGGINRRQLMEAGVPERSIDSIDLCTSCRPDLFFSYRKEAGRTGRQLSFLMLPGVKGGR